MLGNKAWEDTLAPNVVNHLSFSQDSGLTFSSEPLIGMNDASISTSFSSQQVAFDDHWYWFVTNDSTTINVISAVIPNGISITDHYLAYDVKTETKKHHHDDDDDDDRHKHHKHDNGNYNTLAQKWTLTSSGEIKSDLNGYCLDIEGNNSQNGANVIMWPCHGEDNQKWSVSETSQILSKLNDKCLSIEDASKKKKSNVEMLICNTDSTKTDKKDVTLFDEFEGESKYEVKKLKKLLNPVNKNNEGIVNDESHLVEYQIKQVKGQEKFKGIKEIPVFTTYPKTDHFVNYL